MKWYGHIDLQLSSRIKNVPDPQDGRDAISKYHVETLYYTITGNWDFKDGVLILPQAESGPTGASIGQIYWDTTDSRLYAWNGTAWLPVIREDLDTAYHYGNTITVNNGAVILDSTSSNFSPLELTNRTNAPSYSLNAGQVAVINNKLYIYDGSRNKWLTPSKIINFGDNTADGSYLRIGYAKSSNTGWRAQRAGTIVGVSARASGGKSDKKIIIRINNNNPKIFYLNNYQYRSTSDNIDFNAGDIIRVKAASAGAAVNNLIVSIELCWRA